MARSVVEDPLKVFRFRVRVDGFERATFSEVTGLTRTTEVTEYAEGGKNDTNQKSAGRSSFPNISMKRGKIVGVAGEDDFSAAALRVYEQGTTGNPDEYRFDFDIEVYNARNELAETYRIENAWIATFKPMSDFNATASDNHFEEIEVVHEGWSKI